MPWGFMQPQAERARGRYDRLSDQLEHFTPIRYTNLYGTSTMTPEGASFTPTEDFAARQKEIGDFFGQANRNLNEFNQGNASEKTLALLRERRAKLFDPTLSALQSRLLQQGRLGLGTGSAGANPEMSSFFSAEAGADLEAQLAAEQESRNQGQYLFGMAQGARGLFASVADPNAASLFRTADFIQQNRLNAKNIELGGVNAMYQAARHQDDQLHDIGMAFFDMFGGKGGRMNTTSENPMGSTTTTNSQSNGSSNFNYSGASGSGGDTGSMFSGGGF